MVELFGETMSEAPQSWLDPGVFALVGAASFFGGVSRLTISLTVRDCPHAAAPQVRGGQHTTLTRSRTHRAPSAWDPPTYLNSIVTPGDHDGDLERHSLPAAHHGRRHDRQVRSTSSMAAPRTTRRARAAGLTPPWRRLVSLVDALLAHHAGGWRTL